MEIEKLVSQANDAKLLHLCEHTIYPLIDKLRSATVARMCSELKSGKREFLADVGYVAALTDIANELHRIQRNGMTAHGKLEEIYAKRET